MDFFNTPNLRGPDLTAANEHNADQNEKVLAVFRRVGKSLTPCQVEAALKAQGELILLGSVRRAITTLTRRGELRKTDERRMGLYGIPNYCWELNDREREI